MALLSDFFDVLGTFSERDQEAFLRFVWGRSSLPSTDPFPVPFRLSAFTKVSPDRSPNDYLPTSHTCFFAMDLPAYTSKEVLRDRLLYAIYHCVAIDTDFNAHESMSL